MRTDRPTVGRRGEEEASSYLARLGHRILARNWRNGHLELDIISLLGNELHIVEVKSRVAPVMAEPEQNVRRDKQRRMVAAANLLNNSDLKLDAIAAMVGLGCGFSLSRAFKRFYGISPREYKRRTG